MYDMENDSRYRAASLGALLARHYPNTTAHRIAKVVYEMQQAAKKAKAWETRRCNYSMTERQDEAGHARLARMQDNLNKALEACGDNWTSHATVALGGDPRGPCARLSIPGQSGDGWGDGYAIY